MRYKTSRGTGLLFSEAGPRTMTFGGGFRTAIGKARSLHRAPAVVSGAR